MEKNSQYDPIYHTKLTSEMGKRALFSVPGFVTPRTTGQSSYARSSSFPQSAQKVKAHCLSVSDYNTTLAEVDMVLIPTMAVSSNNADAHQLFTIQY